MKPQSIGGGPLTCLICGNDRFDVHEGKLDSKWGFTALKQHLFVCTQCQFVHTFFKGRTIWDFD
ncbi:MAG: hypothetical protein RTU63_03520 [Candidatus Thorarchaeota archaeon]